MRYRTKLTGFASSEKNRLQNCLTVSNIQIANVVSDTFGKSSMKIIKSLLKNSDIPDIESLIHGSMVKKADDIRLAIRGAVTKEQKEKMKVILSHYHGIEECKARLESYDPFPGRTLCQRAFTGVNCLRVLAIPSLAIAIIS